MTKRNNKTTRNLSMVLAKVAVGKRQQGDLTYYRRRSAIADNFDTLFNKADRWVKDALFVLGVFGAYALVFIIGLLRTM